LTGSVAAFSPPQAVSMRLQNEIRKNLL